MNAVPLTAAQIIREIATLPPNEQAEVVRFAYQLNVERQLSGEELSVLARRMADTADPLEERMLREQITRGFYGEKPRAGLPPLGGRSLSPGACR
jgi:hypothetical protein